MRIEINNKTIKDLETLCENVTPDKIIKNRYALKEMTKVGEDDVSKFKMLLGSLYDAVHYGN